MEELTAFMDEFNHHIFDMVSSPDPSEKKGAILAIGGLYFQIPYLWGQDNNYNVSLFYVRIPDRC